MTADGRPTNTSGARAALRVVYCLDSLGTGGSERSLVEYLPTYAQEGIQLTIVCAQHRTEGLEAETIASGADVRFLPPGRTKRIRALRRLLRELRPHLLHPTHFRCDVTGRLAAMGTGIPVMGSLVNTTYDASRRNDPRVQRTRFEAVRAIDAITGRLLCDHFHAVSSSAKQDAVDHLHIPADRITVIHRGRSLDRLGQPSPERRAAARAALGFSDDDQLLLQVGRLEFQKNHIATVQAFAELAKSRPRLHLLFAGREGHESPRVAEAIAASGARSRIHLLGHRGDIPDLLCAADAFVFPSHYEGLPGAVLEAMALRVPIVASDIPPVIDAIEDRSRALLCPPDDVTGLARNLTRVLDDPAAAASMAEAAWQHFDGSFDIGNAARRMVALYRQVADGRRVNRR